MTSLLTEALKKSIPSNNNCINTIIKQHAENNIDDNKNNINDNSSFTSINEKSFDPSKSSPPNDFMIKLQARYMNYFNNSDILSQK